MSIMPSEAPSPLPAQEIKTPQKSTSVTSSLRRSRLCGAALLAFVIHHSSFVIAAPPPELTVLRQQYDKAYAERVTAVFDASKDALDTKFTTALDNAIATAKAGGDLPAVLAIQEDKKAIEAKQALPADTDSTPTALKALRAIYREQVSKLTEQRTANTAALITPYAAKLQQLEATLTKNDRVEEAKEVMDYRVGLKADAPAPQPAMATNAPAPASATQPTSPATTQAPKVKGDDRKAAEWVLGLGGKVTLVQPSVEIASVADLPRGKFEVLFIVFNNTQGQIQAIPDSGWEAVAGLQSLERINCEGIKISSAAFDHIATCTALQQLQIQYSLLDDTLWPHLARLPKINKLVLSYNGHLTGVGISKAHVPELQTLLLTHREVVDAALPEVATLKSLQELHLDGAQITDKGIAALAGLPKLTRLNLIGTLASAQGLSKLKGLPLSWLGFGRTMSEMVEQLPQVAPLFPKLERLILPRESNPTVEEVQVIENAVPGLLQIECRTHKCDDAGAAALSQLTKLETLDLQYAPITDIGIASLASMKRLKTLRLVDAKATDACFESLAKLKSLKVLRFPKPGKGITADGLAKFKKQRPDVKVE